MKPQSRVLLLLLFFSSFLDLASFSARNLLSTAPLCFLLSLYSVLLRPVSSFSLFPFVISRALFFFIFFDALLPPAPIPRCLLLVSVIMSRLSSGCSSSILVPGSGGFGQCAPLNIWISRIEPHGTAGYGERHVFLYSRDLLPSPSGPSFFLRPIPHISVALHFLVKPSPSYFTDTVWKIECSAEYRRQLLIVNTINTLRYDAVMYSLDKHIRGKTQFSFLIWRLFASKSFAARWNA